MCSRTFRTSFGPDPFLPMCPLPHPLGSGVLAFPVFLEPSTLVQALEPLLGSYPCLQGSSPLSLCDWLPITQIPAPRPLFKGLPWYSIQALPSPAQPQPMPFHLFTYFYPSRVDLYCRVNFCRTANDSVVHISAFFSLFFCIRVYPWILNIVPVLYSRTLLFSMCHLNIFLKNYLTCPLPSPV